VIFWGRALPNVIELKKIVDVKHPVNYLSTNATSIYDADKTSKARKLCDSTVVDHMSVYLSKYIDTIFFSMDKTFGLVQKEPKAGNTFNSIAVGGGKSPMSLN